MTDAVLSDRTCGSCSLCCRVMHVPGVKPNHQWCQHVLKGSCKIYAERPQACRDFDCAWLRYNAFGEHWYPKTSRIIVDIKINEHGNFIAFVVDPNYPLRWREEPWFSEIKQIAKGGLGNSGMPWHTVVIVKDEIIPIGSTLPGRRYASPSSATHP